MAKFYTFRQNNTGGSFDIDQDLSVATIVEANSAEHANNIALGLGIYFDGCDKGSDCPCCGDRWYPVDESDGTDTPTVYGKDATQYKALFHGGNGVRIHYLSGKVWRTEDQP